MRKLRLPDGAFVYVLEVRYPESDFLVNVGEFETLESLSERIGHEFFWTRNIEVKITCKHAEVGEPS